MIAVCPLLFLAWKVMKRSKFYKPEEVDLVKNLDEIEEYEANYVPKPAKYVTKTPKFSHSFKELTRASQECFREVVGFPLRLMKRLVLILCLSSRMS